jgi:hypothetical protein
VCMRALLPPLLLPRSQQKNPISRISRSTADAASAVDQVR